MYDAYGVTANNNMIRSCTLARIRGKIHFKNDRIVDHIDDHIMKY